MKSIAHRLLPLAFPLLLLATGCNREDPQKLSAVGNKVGSKAGAIMNRTNDRLAVHWCEGTSEQAPPLDIRVHERLLWDRDLEGTTIQVTTQGTVVELHGNVATPEQRQHAVELARTTLGVERVIEYLVVGIENR